jgi:hypothetical protein
MSEQLPSPNDDDDGDRDRGDLLERALRAARNAPVPDGPPAELVDRTLAALRGASAAGPKRPRFVSNTLITRITTMRFITKLAAAFILAAGVTLLAVLTLRPTSLAWADVLARVNAAKALSFKTTTPLTGTDKTIVQRFLIAADGRQRIETGDGGERVTIIDPKAGVETTLDTKARTAHVLKSKALVHAAGSDPLKGLRDMKPKDAKDAGEREIGGRKVKGFACKAGGSEYVVWADAKSGDPVRVEWALGLPTGQKTTMVMDEFAVEAKVDEAKLDTRPPAGFEMIDVPGGDDDAAATGTATKPATTRATSGPAANVATATVKDVPDAEDVGEDHVIAVLRMYAERSGGKFPPRLDDWAAYAKLTKGERLTEESLRLNTEVASLKFFLDALGPAAWSYDGAALSTADRERVVFRYADPRTGGRRVITGDLKAKEAK